MNASPHDHIVKGFDLELERLTGEIAAMGGLSVTQLEDAMDALAARDAAAAQRVVDADDVLDAQERQVSHDVLNLLALRQPLARDLRAVLAALRIASDIERIGDYAANVAKRAITLNASDPVPVASGLAPMARTAGRLVRDAMRAYVTHDTELARAVWKADDELDAMYVDVFREFLTYMLEDPHSITPCSHLLFIAKNIERIGDHATNIAENIGFAVLGDPLIAPRPAVGSVVGA